MKYLLDKPVCLFDKFFMVRPKKTDPPAREKILSVANDLFFRQGYHQTGTNQLIDQADVSKATFYAHFPSKEDLAIAHVQDRAAVSIRYIREELGRHADPMERYLVFQRSVHEYLKETDFRGCNFSNIAREFPDATSNVRAEVIAFENQYRALLLETVEALFDSDPNYFAQLGLSPAQITDRYYLLLEGAINASANFHDDWPLKAVEPAVKEMVSLRK